MSDIPPSSSASKPAASRPSGPNMFFRCHKSGHVARNCPLASSCSSCDYKSEAPTGNNKPPEPCWTCERTDRDPMHWSHECPVANARRSGRQCVLCDSPDHWIRACDKYDPAKHTPKNPRSNVTYVSTGGPRPRQTWCLRCGIPDHATSDCAKKDPAVLWPSGSEEDRMRGRCCFRGYRGHDVSRCMRQGASLSTENITEISSLKNELSAMKKSIEGVTGLQDSVATVQLQMNSLMAWQTDVVNPRLHRVRENAEEI